MFQEPSRKQSSENETSKALQRDSELAFCAIEKFVQKLEFVEAERFAKEFLNRVEAQCSPSDPLRRQTLIQLSNVLRLLQDFDNADQILVRASELAALHGNGNEEQVSLNDLRLLRADLMRQLGRTEEVLSLSAAVLKDTVSGDPLQVDSYIRMAQAHVAAGNTVQYDVFMQMAYSAADSAQPLSLGKLVDIFLEAGDREVADGRFEGATRLYRKAADLLCETTDDNWQRVAELEMYIAELHERAGYFAHADSLRTRVLRESELKLQIEDEFVLAVREALALGLASHSRGNFEYAEKLLVDNVTLARNSSDTNVFVKALIALSKAHSARGMYDDAMQDLRQAHQLLNEFYEEIHCDVRVEVLREFASLLMECGVREEAELLFRHAVTEAEDMPRPEGIVHEVNLVFSLASILSKEKPVEARTLIERCYDLLDQLPPSHEPVSRTELKLLLLFIDGDEEGAEALEEMAASRLHELQYQYGEGFVSAQAHLMFQKANSLIKIWNLQDARKELERAKQLLERHAKDKTSLYAMVLSRLADTLSPDDSRVFEYRERADEIRRRAEQAGEQLNSRDQEDPDDQ